MALAPWTRRVVAARLDVPGQQPIFTHTGSEILILRDIVLANLHTAAQRIRIYAAIQGVNYDLVDIAAATATASAHTDLRQELLSGETLWMQVTVGPATALITGYFLQP